MKIVKEIILNGTSIDEFMENLQNAIDYNKEHNNEFTIKYDTIYHSLQANELLRKNYNVVNFNFDIVATIK